MGIENGLKRVIIPNDGITVRDFASKIDIPTRIIFQRLFFLGKVAGTLDYVISYEDAKNVAGEYGIICQTESDYMKQEACNDCKKQLNGILSDDELKEFEIAFMTAAEGYIFKRKEGLNYG